MTKQQWIIASSLTTLVVLLLGAYGYWQQAQELDGLRHEAAQAAEQSASLSNDLAQARGRVNALETEKEAAVAAQRGIQDQMKAALQSKDVTISELQGKLTVNILDRILFNSGEASLKPEGEKVLRQIAGVLSQFPHRQIHVIGHTDNVPIRFTARERFPSNWELSTARATAAVRFLCEQAGVDPKRLGAVGYGEFYPVADNSTEEGRAKNRRIELVILPEEISKFVPIAPPRETFPANPATNMANLKKENSGVKPPASATPAVKTELSTTNAPVKAEVSTNAPAAAANETNQSAVQPTNPPAAPPKSPVPAQP